MMKSKIVLTALALTPVFAFAESDYEEVVDDSVVGYWRFNDPNDYGKDASGHGSNIAQWNNNASGGVVSVSTDWSRGGGCLELPRKKKSAGSGYDYGSAVATVTSGKGFSLSRTSPGWTVATWVRGSKDLVDSFGSSIISNPDLDKFKAALSGGWHPLVIVYRAEASRDYYHVYVDAFDSEHVADITAGGHDSPGKPLWYLPLTISTDASEITLGGILGGGYSIFKAEATFFGGLDDCVVIGRELKGGGQPTTEEKEAGIVRTDDEVFRWVQTGETFVYSKGTKENMFTQPGKWSNGKAPQPGLAYIVENGCEVKAGNTATFAGKSLSVGRTEKLYGIKSVGGSKEVIVDNTVGTLAQYTTSSQLTVDDLFLNDGFLASRGSNQTLIGNICVRAVASNPFKIVVSNGTYKVVGTMRGNGSVAKIGPAALDLSGLTESTAKVSLSEGSLRLPAVNPTLSGYSGGTLLVDFDEGARTATTVTIESAWTGVLAFKLNGTPAKTERYAVIKVPTSVKTVTAADFDNQTSGGMSMRTRVVTDGSVQTVYLECVSATDQDGAPVVSFE